MSIDKWNKLKAIVKGGVHEKVATLDKEYKEAQGIKKEAQQMISPITSTTIGLGGALGGSAAFTRPLEYFPEWASPDRWLLPVDLERQLRYWRMFYKMDPIVGTVIEIYSEMLWSDYTIEGVDQNIKRELEEMLDRLNLISLMKQVVVEYLVCGEAIPHLFFDSSKGQWRSYSFYQPEYIQILDISFLDIEPVLILKLPGDVLTTLRKIKKIYDLAQMEFPESHMLDQILSSGEVVLENLNVSYIPRLLHAYDSRGTSILTRLWRFFMYEDAVFNTTLHTVKRHASPVKTVTMGDLASGYIPDSEQVDALLAALAQAETDPQAWVFVPPGTKFEPWGTTERAISIRNEYATIEGAKLEALGVSRDFILGSSTFASAQASLQVFLSRLLSLRNYLEEIFIYKKILRPVILVNRWVEGRDKKPVQPIIKWEKSLKPVVEKDLLEAYKDLRSIFELKLSERTLLQTVGLDWAQEYRKVLEEEGLKTVLENQVLKQPSVEGVTSLRSSFSESSSGGLEEIAPPLEAEMGGGEGLSMHAGSKKADGLLVVTPYRRRSVYDYFDEKKDLREALSRNLLNPDAAAEVLATVSELKKNGKEEKENGRKESISNGKGSK